MSKTILAQIQGWTPLLDRLVERHGIITAAVFGKIWRYCQGEYGVCTASQDRIAKELGLTRETVNQHCQFLVENGYLEAKKNGRTNTYRDTGKAGLLLQITTISSLEEPVNEIHISDTTCELNSQQMLGKFTSDVNEIHTKKVFKKVTRNTTTTENPEKNIYAVYEENIGLLTPFIADELDDLEKTYTEQWVIEAIREAVKSNARNLKYVRAILKRWKAQGFKSQKPGQSSTRSNIPAPNSQAAENRRLLAEAAARDAENQTVHAEVDENGNFIL